MLDGQINSKQAFDKPETKQVAILEISQSQQSDSLTFSGSKFKRKTNKSHFKHFKISFSLRDRHDESTIWQGSCII